MIWGFPSSGAEFSIWGDATGRGAPGAGDVGLVRG